jgi:hypothetical protein
MEPTYNAHDRMRLRQREVQSSPVDSRTASLYEGLREHILRVYPNNGALRSIALRKLAESLNDILDHAQLSTPAPQDSTPPQAWSSMSDTAPRVPMPEHSVSDVVIRDIPAEAPRGNQASNAAVSLGEIMNKSDNDPAETAVMDAVTAIPRRVFPLRDARA